MLRENQEPSIELARTSLDQIDLTITFPSGDEEFKPFGYIFTGDDMTTPRTAVLELKNIWDQCAKGTVGKGTTPSILKTNEPSKPANFSWENNGRMVTIRLMIQARNVNSQASVGILYRGNYTGRLALE